jgi:YD repeat-containing protein
LFGIGIDASAQVISLAGNSSPAIQVQAAATQATASTGHPAQLVDATGRAFAATYDRAGRLSALKATTGRNIADTRVGYDSNGRIQIVRFDNRYQVFFHYRANGTEEVTDNLGGQIVRASAGGGLITQSSYDPSGVLAETLRRVEALFAGIQAVAGLNPVSVATATQ